MNSRKTAKILIALGLAAGILWLFYFPYSRTRLFRPLPINVSYVSEHRDLAGRWKKTVKNPVISNVLKSILGDIDLEKKAEEANIGSLIKLLSPKNTLFAHVPSFKYSGRPAWIVSSWVGGDRKLVRSKVLKKFLPDIREQSFGPDRKGWWVRLDEKSPYGVLSMTVDEGILIACFSSEAEDLEYLLAVSERGNSVSSDLAGKLAAFKGSDKGWINLINYGIRSIDTHELFFAVTSLSGSAMKGWIGADIGFNGATRSITEDDYNQAAELTGGSLEAIAAVPYKNLSSFIAGLKPQNGFRKIAETLEDKADPEGLFFIGLRSREDEGRAMSLAAPSFVLGLKMKDGVTAVDTAPGLLDGINSGFKGSFIPRGTSIGETPVIVVESTRPSTFRGFEKNQKPTFMSAGNWMLLASNMIVLERLFAGERSESEVSLPEGVEKNTLATAWIDVPLMNYSLRDKALPILALIFGVENKPESVRKRRRVDAVDYFVSLLEGARQCLAWLKSDDDMARINFELN